MWIIVCLFFNLFILISAKPHIIVIIADDMGFNDVSFHGSNEIPTPNIDALAFNGVILNNHYTQALCTPSRAAFLTGKYPISLGMQHLVILEPEPWGLSLKETILSQHLKNHGYKTHAVGKWHLGFYKKEYTPTFRGFDTHFGYWQGLQDYYTHEVRGTYNPEFIGYDMRRNMSVDWDSKGKYSTTLFTNEAVKLIRDHDTTRPMFLYLAHLAPHTGNDENPLQAPVEEIAKFSHIKDRHRRIYAAMVSMLDKSVGQVIQELRRKKMLDNSIILFLSDNGAKTRGIHANHGSNYPFRGLKASNWEGSMRNLAAIWSPLIKEKSRVSNELMHITDWLPTLFKAAGLNISELGVIDGKDVWESISENTKSPRTDFVYNIDDTWNYGALRHGDWKYIYGTTFGGREDDWFGSSGRNINYPYKEEVVLNSLAGISFTPLNIFKENNGTINYTQTRDLNEISINKLRKEATIICNKSGERNECRPLIKPCLFNIKNDPCELNNLANIETDVFEKLKEKMDKIRKSVGPIINVPMDPTANPANWNGTWTNWKDFDDGFGLVGRLLTLFEIAAFIFGILAILFVLLGNIYYIRQRRKFKAISTMIN